MNTPTTPLGRRYLRLRGALLAMLMALLAGPAQTLAATDEEAGDEASDSSDSSDSAPDSDSSDDTPAPESDEADPSPDAPDLPKTDADELRDEEAKETVPLDAQPLSGDLPPEPVPDPPMEEQEEDVMNPRRLEPTILPLVAYSSDRGFGVGVLGGLVKNHPEYDPYRWGLSGRALIFIGPKPGGGGIRVPYQSYKVAFTMPRPPTGRVGFGSEVGFRRVASANYYGVGNATTNDMPWLDFTEGSPAHTKALAYYDYRHTRVWGAGRVRVTLSPQVYVFTGGRFTMSWIGLIEDSKLAEDLASGDEDLGRFLVVDDVYGSLESEAGLVYSTLDRPTSPSRGMLHEVSLRGGPAVGSEMRAGYGGVNLQTRFFLPLLEDRLVAGMRFVLDGLFGRPPLPELARYGGSDPEFGIGGGNAVRGVPRQRYHGKVKALSNLELRSVLLRTKLARRSLDIGVVGFFDAGRVWADWRPTPALDGTALGLKVGVGGGLRLQWGPNFVLRTDVAWSPDGVGVYLDAGHAF